jgi:seryl-tRNA synthetase
MLDIKFIRENPDLIKSAAQKKRINFDVDALCTLDDKRLVALKEVEALRAEQNAANAAISSATNSEGRESLISSMRLVKEKLTAKEDELKTIMTEWRNSMLLCPNVPDITVPDGAEDSDNLEVHKWGEPTHFDFEAKNHIDLMLAHSMADFERGIKVSGFRGYFLQNDGFLLANAVWQLALKHWTDKSFMPLLAPALVRRETLMGTGYLPQGEDEIYKTQDGDFLAGTAEVATMGYHMDEIIPKEILPKKFIAFSPCFRREAGAHGKDVRGMIRVHEFFKWEQVVLCEASHETSSKMHEEINRNTEEFIELLQIPYHTVVNCGGDLGLGQVKKFDIELWVPGENTYREISSASYFHDFQTRRTNTRYRDAEDKLRFAHSLNCTAIPTPRILVSIVENYQQADGTIKIPEALRPYMGNREFIGK